MKPIEMSITSVVNGVRGPKSCVASYLVRSGSAEDIRAGMLVAARRGAWEIVSTYKKIAPSGDVWIAEMRARGEPENLVEGDVCGVS